MPAKSLPLLQTPAAGNAAGAFPSPQRRKPGDDSPPVVCRAVFEEMCLLANGDFVCSSCDTSGQRVYGNAFVDRVADVFNGQRYQEMRNWLLQSRPGSWCPAIQFHCPRRSSTPGDADRGTDNSVKLLKIEPVTYCNIKCPACPVVTDFVDDPVIRERRGHKILPVQVMLDVVDQLPDLQTLLYYNFGEPFLHKDTVPFLREAAPAPAQPLHRHQHQRPRPDAGPDRGAGQGSPDQSHRVFHRRSLSGELQEIPGGRRPSQSSGENGGASQDRPRRRNPRPRSRCLAVHLF